MEYPDTENKKLTAKEEKFCQEYVMWLNATKAAINAGYSKKTAATIGCQNLIKLNIKKRIEYLKNNLAESSGISALRISKEHEKIAFMDSGQIRSGWMTLKYFEELSESQKACIQEVTTKQTKRIINDGDVIDEEWVKIKLYDKQKSLDSLSRMLGYDAPVKIASTDSLGNDIVDVVEFTLNIK